MRVGLHQLVFKGDKRGNLARILEALEGSGADLDVFPEYAMGVPEGGVTRRYVEAVAEPLDGEFVRSVVEKTGELGKAAVFTVFLRERGAVYNAAVLAVEGRVAAVYRKIHLFDAFGYRESRVFAAGRGLATAGLGGFRAGLAVCFDLRFPELFRAMAYRGVDLFIVPSAWYRGDYKEAQWLALAAARAHENLAFLVAVNQTGPFFCGRSLVATPFGHVLVDLGVEERSLCVELDPGEVAEARRSIPVLELARRDLYVEWLGCPG